MRIDEIELSVRSTNCLSGANIETIAELVAFLRRKMLEFRNFGKKSLNEIKAKLHEMGLHLGMDLSRFGITPDNVKEKIKPIPRRKEGKKEKMKEKEEFKSKKNRISHETLKKIHVNSIAQRRIDVACLPTC